MSNSGKRASNPQLGWGRNVPQSYLDQEKTALEHTPGRLLLRGGTRKVGDQEGEAKPLCVKSEQVCKRVLCAQVSVCNLCLCKDIRV